jgi:cytochrome P450
VKGETYKWLDELHERYGPVVRVAPNELTTIAVGAWNDIYLKRPQLRKDPHSQTPPLNGVHSLFTAHGPTHARMRRTYANGFSERALKDQAQNVEPYVERLVQRLRREIEKAEKSKETLDIGKFYGYAALDIISDMTFGDSFHGLESDNGHDWIRGFFLGAKFGAVRNSLSYFYPLDRLFGMVFLRLTSKVRARNWKYAADRVKKRLEMAEAGIDRSDFVTPVIGHVSTEGEKGITLTELSNNSLAMVIAGCQLPTIALTTATYLLCKNPGTYQRLQKEVRSSFAKEEDINLQSVQFLPYLSAVVDETLRLHHPTPIHLPRIVPPEGQMIDGQWIPGNVSTGNML